MTSLLKRTRFSVRLLKAFLRKHLILISAFIIVGVIVFFSFPLLNKVFPKHGYQTVGIIGKYTIEDLPSEIIKLIGDGLTNITQEGQIEPSLAESWEINNEGKQYIFSIKDNLFWHDGRKIISKNIDYNFSDVATTYPDNKHLVFDLKEPFAPFLTTVSRPVFEKGLIGSGNYRVKSIKKNGQTVEKLHLVPINKNSNLPSYLYKFYPNESSAITAFKLGEIDIIKDLSRQDEINNLKNTKIGSEVKYDRFVGIYFNTDNQSLSNKNIRQALAYAIRKPWQPRAITSVNQKNWAYNSSVKPYDYDLSNAKNLLMKSNGDSENSEPVKEIELATIPSLVNVAEAIKEDWSLVGINSKIKIISRIEDDFQAILITQIIPDDPDQYSMWHSTQNTNLSHYKSPKIDKLLEEGRKTLDQEKRKTIYLDFQRFLVEDTPVVFLFYPTVYTLERK
jgi:peptide/nickel transport system substrate-binding protein